MHTSCSSRKIRVCLKISQYVSEYSGCRRKCRHCLAVFRSQRWSCHLPWMQVLVGGAVMNRVDEIFRNAKWARAKVVRFVGGGACGHESKQRADVLARLISVVVIKHNVNQAQEGSGAFVGPARSWSDAQVHSDLGSEGTAAVVMESAMAVMENDDDGWGELGDGGREGLFIFFWGCVVL